MIWLLAAPFISRSVKFVAVLTASLIVFILMGASMLGIVEQPWAPWYLSSTHSTTTVAKPGAGITDRPINDPPVIHGSGVTDAQRYLLALGAGFSAPEAIVATAISIAENGSGDPTALSGVNWNGTRDLGLWQINSIHWAKYGGQQALTNPVINVIAAHDIYGPGRNWCAWSTYLASCGTGHTGSFAAFICRAKAAVPGGSGC